MASLSCQPIFSPVLLARISSGGDGEHGEAGSTAVSQLVVPVLASMRLRLRRQSAAMVRSTATMMQDAGHQDAVNIVTGEAE